jgi:enamine deaminase RidA (YjgF/YER057c/UK114 family)
MEVIRIERIRISTGSPWESVVGYCRVIRIGNVVEVAGTTAIKDGEVIGKGDLLTLIEQENAVALKDPSFNLFCENILNLYEDLQNKGIKVGNVNKWSSEWNDHIDFDVYDPEENPINLIEWTPKK